MTAFAGFPRGGDAFFAKLALKQDRDWFKANKAEYERLWEAPMRALFEALEQRLRPVFPKVTPPKHFRIYRDVRFGKDKSPFKTNISAVLPLFGGSATGGTGLYAEFGEEAFVAAGRWMLEGPELARYRAAVAAEKKGKSFVREVEEAKRAGFEVMVHESLKRVPAPYEATHRRGDLLKLKGFALTFPRLKPSQLGNAKLVDWTVKQTRAIAGVLRWLEAEVG